MIKGVLSIAFANLIMLLVNILTNFLLPKYLSIESYAMLKTFSLYTTYIGVLHFGFVDGIYIKYGGKKIHEINVEEMQENISTLRIFQLIIAILIGLYAYKIQDKIIIAFMFVIIPRNIAALFKSIFQVTGNYNKYSLIINISTIFNFIINILLLFCLKTDNYIIYLMGFVIADVIIWIIIEFFMFRFTKKFKLFYFSIKILFVNMREGILIMLGNFSSIILIGMDRMLIKILMDVVNFAEYSFASSIENMVTVMVTPITLICYNYLCLKNSKKDIEFIKTTLLFVGGIVIGVVFPLKFIMEIFLPSYLNSVNVLLLLIGSQYYGIIIKGLYINLYKVKKMQKIYFLKLLCIVCAAFIFNIAIYLLFQTKEAFAFGTYLAMLLWIILSRLDFPETKFSKNEVLYFILVHAVFLICNLYFNSFMGGILYFSAIIILSILFLRKFIIEFVGMFKLSIVKGRI